MPRSLRRLLVYGVLWLAFTLGGVFAAVYLATAVTGVVGTLLWIAGGLGVIAAGPVVARRTMAALVSRA